MRKNNRCIRSKDHFKLLIPIMIIVSFIAFKIILGLLLDAAVYGVLQMKALNDIVSHSFMFYLIGWLIDPLIYILISKCSIGTIELEKVIKYVKS